MKFETFDFRVTQLGYVKVAVENITDPVFRPDGRNAAAVTVLQTQAATAKADLLVKFDALNTARAALDTSRKAGHDACVAVYACMKSCYRSDATALPAIKRLPKSGSTAAQTLNRMTAIAQRWAQLPAVPGTSDPFIVGALTKAGFDALLADLQAKWNAYQTADGQFRSQQDAFGQKSGEIGAFVTAALTQGRALYKPGTPQRGYIDAIPTEPAQQEPAQAIISLAESQSAGSAHLQFDATRATSFQVWRKGPADAQFALAEEVLRPGPEQPGEYFKSGLAGGQHLFQIVGVNSQGEGPASEPATLAVAQAQTA